MTNLINISYKAVEYEFIKQQLEASVVYVHDLPEKFHYVDFMKSVGEIYPQYDGKLEWDVVPKIKGAKSSYGDESIELHTEFAESDDDLPKIVSLYCVEQAKIGGDLILLDFEAAISCLDAELLKCVENEVFNYATLPCISSLANGLKTEKRLFDRSKSGELMPRISVVQLLKSKDSKLIEFSNRLKEACVKHGVIIRQKENSLIIWNNWKTLHGRTKFSSHTRRLKRVCLHL